MLGSWLGDWLVGQSRVLTARIMGFEFGVVKDVEDPWKLGRVRVRFPWHQGEAVSDWAPPAFLPQSDNSGSTFGVPQLDDLVLCVFYNGDLTRPAYLGGVWTPGGKSRLGAFLPRNSLVKGDSTQNAAPSYDPSAPINQDPLNYPEPAPGAWITNDKTRRVNEWRSLGGLRLLLEEFKRRLRVWTHPSTPFKLTVEHFDDNSVQPPRSTPYHRFRIESPSGTVIEVEEDGVSATYTTRISHHAGHKVELREGGGKSEIKLTDKDGSYLHLDAQGGKVEVQAVSARPINLKTAGIVNVDGSVVNVGPNGVVHLAGGGPPIARVGDPVQVAGMVGSIIGGSGKADSG